jgi:RND superfamily putative drug exporter
LLLALAVPALQLRTSLGGDRNNPPFESVRAFRMLARDFGQGQTPILVVVRASDPEGVLRPEVLAGMADLAGRLRTDREVARVESPTDALTAATSDPGVVQRLTGRTFNATHDLAVLRVTPRSEYGTPDNQALIGRIRHQIVPAAPGPPGVSVLTGGGAAPYYEFTTAIYERFWYVVGVILLLSYLFLFLAFRSVFVPFKAVMMNVLALAASFGLLQLVFQRGLGDSLLGIVPEEGIAPWVPVFLFALLFGLSTDYEIFLLSRVRERFAQTQSNAESVAFGLAKTGVLITSAAAIMVFVFGSFLAGSILSFKQIGVALSAAIFIDASLIRVVLVPALMTLMGRWNWWAPRFAGGLPTAPASKEMA